MASHKNRSPRVELHSAKPEPLRIIKRSQTVANCSSSREAFGRGRGESGGSYSSKGSPPQGIDRPLTVPKKRLGGRGSVFDLRAEDSESEMSDGSGSGFEDIVTPVKKHSDLSEMEDDPDLTPKARRQTMRTNSAGAFLKSELHRRSEDIEASRCSVRDNRHSMFVPGSVVRRPHSPMKGSPPKIPERRPSKSKNFFLRAIGGRKADELTSIRRRASSNSTFVRRLSRSRNRGSEDSYTGSIVSAQTDPLSEPGSLDITDIGINSRLSSSDDLPHLSHFTDTSSPVEDLLVLCPQIVITPETTSVDTGCCFLWVAIEITGSLQRADGLPNLNDVPAKECPSAKQDLTRHGRLHSMRVDLHPGQGCNVSEVVGDLHQRMTIRSGETQLLLAKIRFNKLAPSGYVRESSSDGLIAQLENDLGDALTSYLTAELTYKHSAFANIKNPAITVTGMSSHITRLHTEATAVIKRHNPLSAWSPRTSQTINCQPEISPLINLVETYLPQERAREVIRKLGGERAPIPFARRFGEVGGSSEETVKPQRRTSTIASRVEPTYPPPVIRSTISKGGMAPPISTGPAGPFARLAAAHLPAPKDVPETDPARRIWTEMRRTSRGGRSRHPRTSISADHYFSVDESYDFDTFRSGQNSSVSTPTYEKGVENPHVKEERSRIMEVALRNKRSVGQESLQSIVPSVIGRGRGQGGSIGGLGLGRTWFTPSWW